MTISRETARANLAASLKRRTPTFDVAENILALDVVRRPSETWRELASLAERQPWGWSYAMNDDFDRPVLPERQLGTFAALFPEVGIDVAIADVPALLALVDEALADLGADRFESAGKALSEWRSIEDSRWGRKPLHKRLRFLRRFEERIANLDAGQRLRRASMQAKSRLAYEVDADSCDDLTLAMIAYLASRANRRSLFMLGSQSKAVDTVVAALTSRMERSKTTNWAQVALVRPVPKVIKRLDAKERGNLLGRFHAAMIDSAGALAGLWGTLPERMRDEMVMVRGVDSSRWNAFAGSYNTMRAAWIAAVGASGFDGWLDRYCPGKAPRLMASDLAWWYRNSGRELHEDTRMFRELPRPWDVIAGVSELNRDGIRAAAKRVGIKPDDSGWVGPRATAEIEVPEPEQALVHGIAVADPGLAYRLRRAGVYSGRKIRDTGVVPAMIERVELVDLKRGRVIPLVVGERERVEIYR